MSRQDFVRAIAYKEPYPRNNYSVEDASVRRKLLREAKANNKHKYRLFYFIRIPGIIITDGLNKMFIGNQPVSIGNKMLILLLRYILESKKGRTGYLVSKQLQKEKIMSTDSIRKRVLDINIFFNRVLCKKTLKLFDIQRKTIYRNSGYRLSIHPDLITYNRTELQRNRNKHISNIASKLPLNKLTHV